MPSKVYSSRLISAELSLKAKRTEHERLIGVLCGSEPGAETATVEDIRDALSQVQTAYESYRAALKESLERSNPLAA